MASNITKEFQKLIEMLDSYNDNLPNNNEVKVIQFTKELNTNSAFALMRNAPRGRLRYTLGTPHPAHRCLAEIGDLFTFPSPRNFQLLLTYPTMGIGGLVGFIEIIVDQNSNLGRAYVNAGGIGHRFIRIIVDAQAISYFSYKATIYGN